MTRPKTTKDAIGAYQRKAAMERRIGKDARCACGEARTEALISLNGSILCAECCRRKKGHTTMDKHHVAGKANSPATVKIPVNDHRALLSVAQYQWSKRTLENPEGCPLIAAAACIRGFIDTIYYLIEKLLEWIAEMLELLSAFVEDKYGPRWWTTTPFARFGPKG